MISKLLIAIFLLITSLYGLVFMRRCIYYGIDNSIVAGTITITTIGSMGGYIFIGSDYVVEITNIRLGSEPIIYILLFAIFAIASIALTVFMNNGYFTKPNKYEYKLFDLIDRSSFLNNPLTEKVSVISFTIVIIIGAMVAFSFGVDVLEPAGKISKEIQIVGVLKEPGYVDSRGYEEEPQYSISYKLLDESYTRTLNNDNCEIDKLEEYYQAFKKNIESVYTANMSVSKSKKNPDIKLYDLIDIIYDKKIEAK